jgi:DNA ligase-1
VWKEDVLVPVVNLPLPGEFGRDEKAWIARYVRDHVIDRFGPVRSVRPDLVFEIVFEGVGESRRRKSGLILRHPRILGLRLHKRPEEADTVGSIARTFHR